MRVERLAPMGAQRGLEHRVHLHRHHDAALELVGMAHPHLCADQPRRRHLVGLLVPIEDHIGAAGPHPGAPRLSTHEDGAVEGAVEDLARGEVHERLGRVASRGRVRRLGGLDPEPRRHEGGRIAVAP